MKTQRPWTAKVILRKKNSAGGFRYLTWDCTTKLQKDIFELSLNNPFTNRTFLQMKLLPASAEWNFSFSSVQFSRSVVSDSLRPRELQHARPPCPSQTPGVHPDSRPSSQWCHLILRHPLLLLPPIIDDFKICVATVNNLRVYKNSTSHCDFWTSQLTAKTCCQTHTAHHFLAWYIGSNKWLPSWVKH